LPPVSEAAAEQESASASMNETVQIEADDSEEPEVLGEILIDELSIDGMCGVY
jgi:mycofactocin precursor